jgi:hypothetical protein
MFLWNEYVVLLHAKLHVVYAIQGLRWKLYVWLGCQVFQYHLGLGFKVEKWRLLLDQNPLLYAIVLFPTCDLTEEYWYVTMFRFHSHNLHSPTLTHWFDQSFFKIIMFISHYIQNVWMFGMANFSPKQMRQQEDEGIGIVWIEMETWELNDLEQQVPNLIKVWLSTYLHDLVL